MPNTSHRQLSGITAAEFGADEEASFITAVASSLDSVSEDDVLNVTAKDTTISRRKLYYANAEAENRFLAAGVRPTKEEKRRMLSTSGVDVSYSLTLAVGASGASSADALFSTVTSELTTAVGDGSLSSEISSSSSLSAATLVSSAYEEPANYTLSIVYAPTSTPSATPSATPSMDPSKAPTSDDSVAFTETPAFYGIIAVVTIVVCGGSGIYAARAARAYTGANKQPSTTPPPPSTPPLSRYAGMAACAGWVTTRVESKSAQKGALGQPAVNPVAQRATNTASPIHGRPLRHEPSVEMTMHDNDRGDVV